jgi:predicted nucleic acid-binding protein
MVLIDTSVWIDHFNKTDVFLQSLLNEYDAVMHPFVLGELACGTMKNRRELLTLLSNLPTVKTISDEEYFLFIEKNKLYGLGIGFVDIHLLASTMLARCLLYTKDKNLASAATKLSIAFP